MDEQFISSLSKVPCWVPLIQDYLDNSRDSVVAADPTSCSPPQYLMFVPLNRWRQGKGSQELVIVNVALFGPRKGLGAGSQNRWDLCKHERVHGIIGVTGFDG